MNLPRVLHRRNFCWPHFFINTFALLREIGEESGIAHDGLLQIFAQAWKAMHQSALNPAQSARGGMLKDVSALLWAGWLKDIEINLLNDAQAFLDILMKSLSHAGMDRSAWARLNKLFKTSCCFV